MHYDFFIAGRWRNKENVSALERGIRERGYTAYCFLSSSHNADKQDVDPHAHMNAFERLDWKNDAYVKTVFEEDMQGERGSDAFVLLLPAGLSCHIEAGVAYGLGKKCVLIGTPTDTESLYQIFSEHYETIDQFLSSLPKKSKHTS